LEEALQYAIDHYPSVRAAVEQINVSSANASVARSAYLPRLDSLWQTNRGTANNIFGQLLPQSVIPAMSGPVLTSASTQSVWGSAAGALLSWEPFDFGLRDATVEAANAGVARARADEALTRLDVQSAVGAAFLAFVGAQQALTAADADVQRREVLARAARTLADNQLRPGAEASRADAERAAAQTRAIQARQAVVIAETTLRRVLGIPTGAVVVDTTRLLDRLPSGAAPAAATPEHPLTRSRQASVDLARANENVLAKTDRPRLYLQSSVFARGSGANADGAFDGGADGLGLERANWAAGVQVVFPNLFDFSSLHARRAASSAATRAEGARYDEALLTVTSQQQTADALVDAARAIRAEHPGAIGGGATERSTGSRAVRGRAGKHRRSRRRPGPARAGGVSECRGASRRVARTPCPGRHAGQRGRVHRTASGVRRAVAMWLIRAALRRPITIIVAVAAIAMTAAFAVSRMRADVFPDLDLPVIYVAQPYGGMSPARWRGTSPTTTSTTSSTSTASRAWNQSRFRTRRC
jgi:outer membrane protein TolC